MSRNPNEATGAPPPLPEREQVRATKKLGIRSFEGQKIVDMGEGFFLVQFTTEEAYQEAVLEGPWTLLLSYLQVQSWTTAFRVAPLSTAVWIRISELPLHFYPSEVISAIGEAVGKVIRVDSNTSGMQRGKFARLAVNIDLTKPLVSTLTIDGEEFKVEYGDLQELCFHCGMYGHLCDTCAHRPKGQERGDQGNGSMPMEVASAKVYGPWMVVAKRRKPYGRGRDEHGRRGGIENPVGSRFDVLGEEEEEWRNEEEREISGDSSALMAVRGRRMKGMKGVVVCERRAEGMKGGNKKGKNLAVEASCENSLHGFSQETLNQLKPRFEYKNKARLDEKIVPSVTTLDARTHTAVRVETELVRKDAQGVLSLKSGGVHEVGSHSSVEVGVCEDMIMDPTVERQELGRPLDRGNDVLTMTSGFEPK